MSSLLHAEERVLSTLNADGSRRWLTPRISQGKLWKRRRTVAYALIALFVALPHVRVGGRQAFFLDIASGEFTLFGYTFLRTDTVLLALAMVSTFVTIFLVTAMFGRVWCGWACPQTVYLEFVFRPFERLFDGKRNKWGPFKAVSALPEGARKAGKWIVYAVFAFFIANTFLSYFVGTEQLRHWITSSPAAHPFGFGVVVFVTGAMLFDFGFFREQLCIVACPYGRFQSVLLDRNSLIVGYDERRGEPRGRMKKARGTDAAGSPDVSLRVMNSSANAAVLDAPETGDCIDCGNCVKVCPTGIDIRNGLQLECIHCAQCIDACNEVMDKIGRAPDLIKYTTKSALETGTRKLLRPRVVLYPLVLAVLLGAITFLMATKSPFDVAFMRGQGMPFNVLPSGEITNQGRIRITNRTDEPRAYTIAAEGLSIRSEFNPIGVAPGQTVSERVLMVMPTDFFAGTDGDRIVQIVVEADDGATESITYKLLGPVNPPARPEPAEPRPADEEAQG